MLMLYSGVASAQLGLGTNSPSNTAVLDLASESRGFLIPRMTEAQRDLITTPRPEGLLIYQTNNTPGFRYWNGTAWTTLGGGSATSIYTSDGTLSGARTITGNGNDLTFKGGDLLLARSGTDNNPLRITVSKTSLPGNVPAANATAGVVYYEVLGTENHVFGGHILPDDEDKNLGAPDIDNRWNTVYTINGVDQTSDMRHKKNVEQLGYGLSEIMKVNTITFDWKTSLKPHRNIGFNAQQLQSVMPELVNVGDDADKTLSVNYGNITPVLVNAVKELQAEIDALKAENARLSAEAVKASDLAKSYAELAAQVKKLDQKIGTARK